MRPSLGLGIDGGTCHGKPTFRRTGVPVSGVPGLLAAGALVEGIAKEHYPGSSEEIVGRR